MSNVPASSKPTESDLLLRGFFHDRMIRPLSTLGLKPAELELIARARKLMADAQTRKYRPALPVRSRCVQHSIPKRKHLRRTMSIPNPLHQCILICEVVDHWDTLLELCKESIISLTLPKPSKKRALEFEHDRKRETLERAKRSVGSRYVLKTDLARFYPSIYTHSIPWAIHGKAAARADKDYKLFGNRIDLWLRETQDKQTGGIPVGPDTSFLMAEIIASRLDKELQSAFDDPIYGTRYVDDYNLYFASLSDAEKGLSVLHRAAREYELEINDLKTQILEVPEPLEPHWKTQLRSMDLQFDDHATSIKALFDRAYELAKEYTQDSVLTYVAKKLLSATIATKDWEVCESLLLRSLFGEPSMIQWLLQVYQKCEAPKSKALAQAVNTLCQYLAPLQQSNEIAWSLWTARALEIKLSKETALAVSNVNDDVVALVSLDMMANGFLPQVTTPLWDAYLNAEALYSDHWLLAYEAYEQGWRRLGNNDYIATDPHGCFQILRKSGVRFYDPETRWEGGAPSYGEEQTDETEDDDQSTLDDVFPFGEDLGI